MDKQPQLHCRKSASSETKALQKAMGESEHITTAFYDAETERRRGRIAAKRAPSAVSLFADPEPAPVQQPQQYSLF